MCFAICFKLGNLYVVNVFTKTENTREINKFGEVEISEVNTKYISNRLINGDSSTQYVAVRSILVSKEHFNMIFTQAGFKQADVFGEYKRKNFNAMREAAASKYST